LALPTYASGSATGEESDVNKASNIKAKAIDININEAFNANVK
jgi:hypothetical protein